VSVTRAEGNLPPHPSVPGYVEVLVAERLSGVEADVADVTTRALALVADAVAAREQLRSEVVQLVLLSTLATAAVTAGLCVAAIVILH
jgi:hypothetical protein